MRKKRLILILTALLIGTACLHAQKVLDGQKVKAILVNKARTKAAKASGTDQHGVTANLKYEQIADMKSVHYHHQTFPSGSGFVVVGGYDKALERTKSAELYENGKWSSLTLTGAEAPTFSTTLADGRVMIGGGAPSGAGTGQAKSTAIYDPSTHTFTQGPDMTVARSQCSGILIGKEVYVSGNWCKDDKVFDRYDGSKFSSFGKTSGYMKPYLFTDDSGNIYAFGPKDNNGKDWDIMLYEGKEVFVADAYYVADATLYSLVMELYAKYLPLELPDEMRTTDYYSPSSGGYFILAKSSDGEYLLTMLNLTTGMNYDYSEMSIPVKDAATNESIDWRGGAYVNEAKSEVYLIGSSNSSNGQKLHIISFNFKTEVWSYATADGFDADLTTASWTLLSDGRLACTGGISRSTYLPVSTAYIFTPPTAGTDGTETGPDNPDPGPDDPDPGPDNPDPGPDLSNGKANLVVVTKSGEHEFRLAEKPEVFFTGTKLRVATSKGDVDFEISDVVRFLYKNISPTGITDLTVDDDPTAVNYQEDGVLVISQLKKGAAVNVYAMDGKTVRQLKATHAGTYRLSLSALPKGVYIVKADTITYKIMKR